jgi:hypothetical protein
VPVAVGVTVPAVAVDVPGAVTVTVVVEVTTVLDVTVATFVAVGCPVFASASSFIPPHPTSNASPAKPTNPPVLPIVMVSSAAPRLHHPCPSWCRDSADLAHAQRPMQDSSCPTLAQMSHPGRQ